MNKELQDLYIDLVAKVLDVEQALVKHLPKTAEQVTDEELKKALLDHLEETKLHVERLTQVRGENELALESKPNEPFHLMLKESEETASSITDNTVKDAYIAASARGVEHYEIGKYETLSSWAEQLGLTEAMELFDDTLSEEEAALSKLAGLSSTGLLSTGLDEVAASADEV